MTFILTKNSKQKILKSIILFDKLHKRNIRKHNSNQNNRKQIKMKFIKEEKYTKRY